MISTQTRTASPCCPGRISRRCSRRSVYHRYLRGRRTCAGAPTRSDGTPRDAPSIVTTTHCCASHACGVLEKSVSSNFCIAAIRSSIVRPSSPRSKTPSPQSKTSGWPATGLRSLLRRGGGVRPSTKGATSHPKTPKSANGYMDAFMSRYLRRKVATLSSNTSLRRHLSSRPRTANELKAGAGSLEPGVSSVARSAVMVSRPSSRSTLCVDGTPRRRYVCRMGYLRTANALVEATDAPRL